MVFGVTKTFWYKARTLEEKNGFGRIREKSQGTNIGFEKQKWR